MYNYLLPFVLRTNFKYCVLSRIDGEIQSYGSDDQRGVGEAAECGSKGTG